MRRALASASRARVLKIQVKNVNVQCHSIYTQTQIGQIDCKQNHSCNSIRTPTPKMKSRNEWPHHLITDSHTNSLLIKLRWHFAHKIYFKLFCLLNELVGVSLFDKIRIQCSIHRHEHTTKVVAHWNDDCCWLKAAALVFLKAFFINSLGSSELNDNSCQNQLFRSVVRAHDSSTAPFFFHGNKHTTWDLLGELCL